LKTPSPTSTDVANAITELVKSGVRERAISAAHADLLPTLISGALRAVVLRRIAEDAALAADADEIVNVFLEGARR
jgi:hypothetical protein